MSNVIQIKRSTTAATPSTLAVGELAHGSTGDVFIGKAGNEIVKIAGQSDVTKLAGIAAGAQVNTVDSVAGKTGAVSLVKGDVGLGNVDNTADASKPVSTAQQTALDLKANIASPTFTGTVSGITAAMVGAPSGSGTSSGTNTGDQDLSGLVTKVTTVNGHALTSNVTVTASDVSLGNVTNESKATMFTSPTFTGTVTLPTSAPTNALEAASKGYVDSVASGSFKDAVKTATTAAGTFATSFANGSTVGGVAVSTGDRILIKNQADATQNGIYDVQATGAPVRSSDADNSPEGELKTGSAVFVTSGTLANTQWAVNNSGTVILGTTNLTFAQIGGSNSYSNGTGLTLTGSTFAIDTSTVVSKAAGVIESLSGANLTSLNASNISSGTIADARLSANVLLTTSTIDGGTF
jgi:hypothetical protein